MAKESDNKKRDAVIKHMLSRPPNHKTSKAEKLAKEKGKKKRPNQ